MRYGHGMRVEETQTLRSYGETHLCVTGIFSASYSPILSFTSDGRGSAPAPPARASPLHPFMALAGARTSSEASWAAAWASLPTQMTPVHHTESVILLLEQPRPRAYQHGICGASVSAGTGGVNTR
jgi:hypothetical protein